VAGDDGVAAGGGELLQLADGGDADIGSRVDPAAGRYFLLDVLGQVGRVEGEHEPAPAGGGAQVDHEALVAWRVPGGEYRGHPGRDLRVAVGQAPVQRRVVEVDAEDAVGLDFGCAGQAEVQLGPLEVHRHAAGEVLETARVSAPPGRCPAVSSSSRPGTSR
jgi:hypothetical protein